MSYSLERSKFYIDLICKTNNKVKTAVMAVVGLVVILILAATVLPDVINDTVSESYTEPFSSTTGAGETTDTVTFTYPHYFEDLTNLSATSDNESDDPTVLTYDEDSYNCTVGGLAASDTRILTVTYYRESNQQYTGFSSFVRFTPFLLVIGAVAVFIWVLFSRFGHGHRGS